jgi:hypothetical protein
MCQKSLFEKDHSHQSYIQEKVQPYFPALWKSFVDPWNDLQRRRRDDHDFAHLSGADSAHWMHAQSVHRASLLFSQHHPNVRIQDAKYGTSRMFTLLVEDEISISLKKFRGPLLKSNYATFHNKGYWTQSLFAEPSYNVIFGYKLFKSETEIRVFLTYPVDHESNGWAFRIPDQSEAAAKLEFVAPDTSQGSEEERKRRVRPTRKQAAKGNRGQTG